MGIGYMALWGFGAKCLSGWMGEWSGWYPLDCYDYKSTCGAKNCVHLCAYCKAANFCHPALSSFISCFSLNWNLTYRKCVHRYRKGDSWHLEHPFPFQLPLVTAIVLRLICRLFNRQHFVMASYILHSFEKKEWRQRCLGLWKRHVRVTVGMEKAVQWRCHKKIFVSKICNSVGEVNGKSPLLNGEKETLTQGSLVSLTNILKASLKIYHVFFFQKSSQW